MKNRESLLNEELTMLKGEGLHISKSQDGNLQLEIKGGKIYDNIGVKRAFPYSYKDKYILFKDKEGREIGILEGLCQALVGK